MKNKNLLTILAILFMSFSALPLFSQPPPPPVANAPIDGGAIAMLIGVAILGYKNLRNKAN